MHACIDLGSNSFHLLIGEWVDGRIQLIERLSEKVQLGEHVRQTGHISPEAYLRGLECLERFKTLMDSYPLEQYWALGTNTFRVASNARAFIIEARDLGIDISIISGEQEAILVYAGVLSALPVSDSRRLVIDIGGGSTEIIVGRDHEHLFTQSLVIGSVTWRDRFFASAPTEARQLMTCMQQGKREAEGLFSDSAPQIRRIGWDEAYASSGTMKMLARVCTEAGLGDMTISREALRALAPKMAEAIASGDSLPGLKEPRRELLLPGWCVMTGLMDAYGINEIRFSPTALREGMLDYMVKNEKTLGSMTDSELPQVVSADPQE